MSKRKQKLVFISKGDAGFVRNDRESLSRYFRIHSFVFPDRKGIAILWPLTQLLFFCLWHLPRSAYCYLWFADHHTVLPIFLSRIFSVRSLLIIGGYDAADLPEYSYGAHRSRFRSHCVDFSCRWSSEVVVVSQFVGDQLMQNTSGKFRPTLIYNALKVKEVPGLTLSGKKYVCTVCPGDKEYRYKIKGLDVFLKAATALPELPFLIIGPRGALLDKVSANKPKNLKVIPSLPHAEFMDQLKRIKIICQFSRYESFGMSLLEGMQAGALPMSARDIGTAEIVPQEDRFLVDIADPEEVIEKIRFNYREDYDPARFSDYAHSRFNQKDRIQKIVELLSEA